MRISVPFDHQTTLTSLQQSLSSFLKSLNSRQFSSTRRSKLIDDVLSHTFAAFLCSFSPARKTGVNSTRSFGDWDVGEDIINLNVLQFYHGLQKSPTESKAKLTNQSHSTCNVDNNPRKKEERCFEIRHICLPKSRHFFLIPGRAWVRRVKRAEKNAWKLFQTLREEILTRISSLKSLWIDLFWL